MTLGGDRVSLFRRGALVWLLSVAFMTTYQTWIEAVEGTGWWYSLRLARRAVETQGRVVGVAHSGSTCGTTYVFDVGGATHQGGAAGCELTLGGTISVYYLPEAPDTPGGRTTVRPQHLLLRDLAHVGMLGVVLPTVVFWAWVWSERRRASNGSTAVG